MWFCVCLCMSKYSPLLPCSIFFYYWLWGSRNYLHCKYVTSFSIRSSFVRIFPRVAQKSALWIGLKQLAPWNTVFGFGCLKRPRTSGNWSKHELGGLEWRFVVSNSLRTWFTTSNPSQLSEAVNWQVFGHFWTRVSYLYSLYTQGLVSSNFVCFERASFMTGTI